MRNDYTGEETAILEETFTRLRKAGYPEAPQEPRGPRVVVAPDPVYKAEVAATQAALTQRARRRKAGRKPRGRRE